MSSKDARHSASRKPVKIGNSEIRPISTPSKNGSQNGHKEDYVSFAPAGSYQPERFPELERVFKSWRGK
jgi:hypothetical protein